jgi:hypothetical protein
VKNGALFSLMLAASRGVLKIYDLILHAFAKNGSKGFKNTFIYSL